MRRALILATAGVCLAGCGSMSIPGLDSLQPPPPSMTLQLESLPAGAEARTSLGPACQTPCAVSVPRTDNFTVTYSLDRYLPQTVPVRLVEPQINPQDARQPEPSFDPNPVYVELQLAPQPRRRTRSAPKRTSTAPPPAAAPAPPPAAAPAPSPFPSPVQQRFPPPG